MGCWLDIGRSECALQSNIQYERGMFNLNKMIGEVLHTPLKRNCLTGRLSYGILIKKKSNNDIIHIWIIHRINNMTSHSSRLAQNTLDHSPISRFTNPQNLSCQFYFQNYYLWYYKMYARVWWFESFRKVPDQMKDTDSWGTLCTFTPDLTRPGFLSIMRT